MSNIARYWFDEGHDTVELAMQRIDEAIDMVFSEFRKYHTAAAVNQKLGLSTAAATLEVKNQWANDLAVLTPRLVHRGLKKAGAQDWCPTLAQFITLCKPSADESFIEAQVGMSARSRGQMGRWSCPAVYWAAIEFGATELKTAQWHLQGKRWAKFFNDAWEKQEAGKLDGVPAPVPETNFLPNNPSPVDAAKVAAAVDKVKTQTNVANPTSWAWLCKSLSAAKSLADGLNGFHSDTLAVAGKHHLSTGKLAKDGERWIAGTFWSKPARTQEAA